ALKFVAKNGEVELHGDRFGETTAPAVLLLAGNGCSSEYWPEDFCELIVAGGFQVIRFDYRDTGFSSRGTGLYSIPDLQRDAVRVLDACKVKKAHLVGLSMGGFLAQRLALDVPERVLTVTSIMSTSDYATMLHVFSGGPAPTSGLPLPSSEWLAALKALDVPARELMLESWRLAIGDAAFDRQHWSMLMNRAEEHGDDSRAGDLHRAACLRSERLNILGELASAKAPMLFIEGELDPIFPVGHAAASAKAANGRQLKLEGIGHGLAPSFYGRIVDAVLEHLRRS
ncbi:MAG: alpha/beta fold hydrolase, partial [Archangium sp.]